jgi:hypothetical protein
MELISKILQFNDLSMLTLLTFNYERLPRGALTDSSASSHTFKNKGPHIYLKKLSYIIEVILRQLAYFKYL